MDTLPYPSTACQPPIVVDFICGDISFEWANIGSFEDESQWTEWTQRVELLESQILLVPRKDPSAAKRLQAVVYFGFLSGILGSSFQISDFIRDFHFVTLMRLNELLAPIRTARGDNWVTTKADWLSRVSKISTNHIDTIPQCSLCKVILSIKAMQASLLDDDVKWESSCILQIMKERMLYAGWCPYWTEIWSGRIDSISLLHYISAIKSTGPSSTSCTIEKCSCNNVDWNTYKTLHVSYCRSETCSSAFTGVNSEFIAQIIKAGGVPLLKLSRKMAKSPAQTYTGSGVQPTFLLNPKWVKDGFRYEIDIVEYKPRTQFVAISHVWSGGLGNIKENSLPRCQLEYIYGSVLDCRQRNYDHGFYPNDGIDDAFPLSVGEIWDATDGYIDKILGWFSFKDESNEPLYVWIDALCIPVADGTSDRQQVKRAAIDSMGFIYTSAAHVLVIDPILREISVKNEVDPDIAVRLATSAWFTRCWTFQEGFLARRLSFAFLDRTLNPRIWEYGTHSRTSKLWTYDHPKDRCRTHQETAMKVEALQASSIMSQVVEARTKPFGMIGYLIRLARRRGIPLDPEEGGGKPSPLMQQAQTFCRIWNELAQRTTTQPEDVPGILATAMGLKPSDAMEGHESGNRLQFRQMKMILRSIKMLPISMITEAYPPTAELCEIDRWVPAFPAGKVLVSNEAFMAWTGDHSGLRLPLDNHRLTAFAFSVPDHFTIEQKFNLAIRAGQGFQERWYGCELIDIRGKLVSGGKEFCVVFNNSPARQSAQTGALFDLTFESHFIRLRFCCPLIYNPHIHTSAPTLIALPVSPQIHCILECGSDEWRPPRHSPVIAEMELMSPKVPAFTFLTIYWITLSMFLPNEGGLEESIRSSPEWIRGIAQKVLVDWGRWIMYPTIDKFTLRAYMVVFRAIFFLFLEARAMDISMSEVRRNLFARNLARTHDSKARFTPETVFLYQYPTFRSLAQPLVVAGYIYVGGPYFFISKALGRDIVRPTWKKCFTYVATIILVETALRITGELFYRKIWPNLHFLRWNGPGRKHHKSE